MRSSPSPDALPLVLIPGLLSDATVWTAQAVRFAADRRVLVPAGHLGRPSIAAMAEAVLDEMPLRFALVGWSMGGYVAFEIMRRAARRVDRLALICTSAWPDDPAAAPSRRASVEIARRLSPSAAWREGLHLSFHRPERLPAGTVAELVAMADRLGADLYASQQEAIIDRVDSRGLLAAIACPTLVVSGVFDRRIPPARSREMAAAIDRAELHVLADCGHNVPIEKPDALNALLAAWLERAGG